MLAQIVGKSVKVIHGPERPGDVRHSKANIGKAEELLGYKPKVRFEEGLEKAYQWYTNKVK